MRHRFTVSSLLWLAFYVLANFSNAQYLPISGGRAAGMGNTSLLLEDEFGLFNNPAALTVARFSGLGAYNMRYTGIGLAEVSAALLTPIANFNSGLGINYYGDEIFNQMDIRLAGSHKSGFARLGLSFNYHQFYLENYGFKRSVSLDAGGLFELLPVLELAILIRNITRATLSNGSYGKLSSVLATGISYQPINNFRIDLQIDKNIELPLSATLGIEYLLTDIVAIRTGFKPTNSMGSLGFGLSWKHLKFDFAGQYQSQIGYSAMFSFVITRSME